MTVTRDKSIGIERTDQGVGTTPSPRPDAWAPQSGPIDTGTATQPASRPETLGVRNTFVPPLWR